MAVFSGSQRSYIHVLYMYVIQASTKALRPFLLCMYEGGFQSELSRTGNLHTHSMYPAQSNIKSLTTQFTLEVDSLDQ